MAESASGSDKTEKPSAQKLRKAREQGQVSRSRELAMAVGLLVCLRLLVWLMPTYLEGFRALFVTAWADLEGPDAMARVGSSLPAQVFSLLFQMLLPLAAVPMSVMLVSLIPGGWVFTGAHLQPKLERLSPMANLGRLFTSKHGMHWLASVGKVLVMGLVLYAIARSSSQTYVQLQGLPLGRAVLGGAGMLLDAVMAMCGVFLLFAMIDVPLQRFFFMRDQRMTKQEVKEEYKTSEGRPEIRQRVRQLQRQMAQRAVRKTVPGADVVIVNPEHFAVALKYDTGRAEAPYVVAKGVDEMAFYIRQVAGEHGVEIIPAPPLARAIYHTSQVHQQIPATLYRAVALVLSYVMQIKAFRQGQRPLAPSLPSDLPVPAHLSGASAP
ncbi:MAG: flagellar type III secretion system protein FlhB [Aquabacterium sp.]